MEKHLKNHFWNFALFTRFNLAIMKVAGKVHDDIFHYLHEAGADLNIKFIQFIQ